jgi:hypothetical protein
MTDAERREKAGLRSERWRRAHGIGPRRPSKQGPQAWRKLDSCRVLLPLVLPHYDNRNHVSPGSLTNRGS